MLLSGTSVNHRVEAEQSYDIRGKTRKHFLCEIWPGFTSTAALCSALKCIVKFLCWSSRSQSKLHGVALTAFSAVPKRTKKKTNKSQNPSLASVAFITYDVFYLAWLMQLKVSFTSVGFANVLWEQDKSSFQVLLISSFFLSLCDLYLNAGQKSQAGNSIASVPSWHLIYRAMHLQS